MYKKCTGCVQENCTKVEFEKNISDNKQRHEKMVQQVEIRPEQH